MIKVGDLVEMTWAWKHKARDIGVVVDIGETLIFENDKLVTVLSSKEGKTKRTTLSGIKKINP